MPDTERRFKTVGEIKSHVRKTVAGRLANHPNLTERLTARVASALGGIAGLPFQILSEFPVRGTGGKVVRPGPNEFQLDDLDIGGPVPEFYPEPSEPSGPVPPPTGSGVPSNAPAIVQAVRSHYGTPMRGGTLLAFLRETARALGPGAGLLSKTSGNNVGGYAADIIMFKDGDIYDVLVDSEGAAKPCWAYKGKKDPGLWRAP